MSFLPLHFPTLVLTKFRFEGIKNTILISAVPTAPLAESNYYIHIRTFNISQFMEVDQWIGLAIFGISRPR